ncbi:MAG: YfhO family protein [Ruminococcus sp.]|nr:YfhO family protein [Ruminococcus sp.]
MDNNPMNDNLESEETSETTKTQTDDTVAQTDWQLTPKGSSKKTTTKTKDDKSILSRLQAWAMDKRYYILAFILPCVIMYIAYALFDAFPAKSDGEHSVLVLDLNGQYVYYFEYFRQALLGENSIFYSWSRNLSGEFMGIIGYYLASPFTLITVLFPQKYMTTSLFVMQLCKLGTQGVTMSYYLQHSKKVNPLHSVIFSTAWGVCSYAVVQLMNPMWLDGLIYMPLIMIGIEKIIDEKKKVNFIIPLALMFIANFYIGFMLAIFSVLYFLFYFCFVTEREYKSTKEKVMSFVDFGVGAIVGAMLSAIMILPVYYSLKLGKFDFTDPDYSLKIQFTAIDMLTRLLPSCYDTVRNEGLADIYCGVICILMTPLYILNRKIKPNKKIGYTILLAVLFFSMYIKPIDMLWHGGQVPNWLPYRYSFIISFLLISMSAEVFKNHDGIRGRDIAGVFAGVVIYVLWAETREYENLDSLGSLWFAVALVFCFALLFYGFKSNPKSKTIPMVMTLILCCELTMNAFETLKDIDDDVTYSSAIKYDEFKEQWTKVTDEVNSTDSGLYRSEKTDFRTVNDDLLLNIKGITHSSSTMNAKAIDFISSLGFTERGHYTRYNGLNTLIADDLLGIKYLYDEKGLQDPTYELYYSDTESDIKTYINDDALPIGYMVSTNAIYTDLDYTDTSSNHVANPFENQNNMLSSMLGTNQQFFTRLYPLEEPVYDNVEVQSAGVQTKYTATGSGDHTITYVIQSESDNPIYLYLPAINEKKINVWYSTTYNEDTEEWEDYEFLDYYYETQYYNVKRLGYFSKDQYISIRLTIANEYCYMIDQWFYQLDAEAESQAIAQLATGGWELTSSNSGFTKMTAEVTAQSGQILFTSIPLEAGWTVKVDGKKVEPVELYGCLMGIPVSEGTHTIKLSFFPEGLALGIVLFIIAIPIVIFFMMQEKKISDKMLKNMLHKKD